MSKKKKNNDERKDLEPKRDKSIKPKTINQKNYVRSIRDNTLTFSIGPAASGKTLLAVDFAIKQINNGVYEKLIITRPVVEAGEELGFLPGDLEEKLDPYTRPVIDYIQEIIGSNWKAWFSKHLEIAALAFMRGRTFNNSILILDEAQNTTQEQMRMFLTRIGQESKAIITADPSQIDLKVKSMSGILEAIELLGNKEHINICKLDSNDIIRSEIVRIITEAYNEKYLDEDDLVDVIKFEPINEIVKELT